MEAEGELRSNLEESDRVRELQEQNADLKAEVRDVLPSAKAITHFSDTNKTLWYTKMIFLMIFIKL